MKNIIKNKKGVSLLALGVVVIVMSILVGMTALSTNGLLQETKVTEFASELKQLEYLVKQSKMLNDNKDLNFTERVLSVSTLNSVQKEQMNEEISSGATQITLYEIDFAKIDANDTRYGKKLAGDANDVYVVSNTTGKVYYLKGYKWEGKMYYTLTDELKALLSI